MTLEAGQRVKLAADLRLAGSVTLAEDDPAEVPAPVASALSLASGTEGAVEQVNDNRDQPLPQSHEVREYLRLKSLLDDFGHQMPPVSRKQLEEQVDSLEPEWIAYQGQKPRVTVRVRLDNGFVLDEARAELFTPA
ncbi:hypothetical protein OG625_03225 [Streptomyces sp. NBC_01351]|uniref:hypothetical protein n=1 Tax=Streptomyces sp. NBC_01351 TaxID=2903833 RepID=UPI002E313CDE|nr:hypothetical protein [Streptomyces sp. NBC_01351]